MRKECHSVTCNLESLLYLHTQYRYASLDRRFSLSLARIIFIGRFVSVALYGRTCVYKYY